MVMSVFLQHFISRFKEDILYLEDENDLNMKNVWKMWLNMERF